jgi:hypothetical protein
MNVTTSIRAALSIPVMIFALATAAQAASVARTWVSSTGLDTNTASSCPRTAPCKSFVGAYSVTLAGGEIIALDDAGYGPLTITGPLSITATEGAIITVQTNTTGIIISTGAGTDVVTLRNLQIAGAAGSSNTRGIVVNQGRLVLQNSSLKSLTMALQVNSTKTDVIESDFIANGTAISTTGQGIDVNVSPPIGLTAVRIKGGNVIDNTIAYQMNDPGLDTNPNNGNRVTIFGRQNGGTTSDFSINQEGNGTLAIGSGPSCDPTVSGNCLAIGTYINTSNSQF